jgi:hypothetical protein
MATKEYFREHHRKYKEKYRENNKRYHHRIRMSVIGILGGKCSRCGFEDWRALQIDHINGGGSKEKIACTVHYQSMVIKSAMNGENKYQLLCANCNWIKGYENNETAHA